VRLCDGFNGLLEPVALFLGRLGVVEEVDVACLALDALLGAGTKADGTDAAGPDDGDLRVGLALCCGDLTKLGVDFLED
jgi:hypothetical protein